ncbi:MAG: DUF4262 domain-containing protein [Bacteroidia bacterium]|nr:DUF4262 domain-containing protein [Bacteroidia bacterium]
MLKKTILYTSIVLISIILFVGCNNSINNAEHSTMESTLDQEKYSSQKKKIAEDVEKFGFHIAFVPENEYLPAFAYTIGLNKSYKHPEIIIFGLRQEIMGEILNELGTEIKKGKIFHPNIDYDHVISNYPVRFLEIKKEHYRDYLGFAGWFYNNSFDFPAYQLVWTDKQSNYPWDDEFYEAWRFKQPLLDRNTDFKFYEKRNTAVFTTQKTLEGKPILWVYHDKDGNWQFHSEKYPRVQDGKIVCLENLVHLDTSLNELFYLNFGQSAWRETADTEWNIEESEE